MLGAVPITVVIATMAGFALGQLRVAGGQFVFVLFLLGLTLPFEGIIVPLYYEILRHGAPGHPLGDHPAADRACSCRSACSGCARTS